MLPNGWKEYNDGWSARTKLRRSLMECQSEIKMKFTIGVMKKGYSNNFHKISCKISMKEDGIRSDFRPEGLLRSILSQLLQKTLTRVARKATIFVIVKSKVRQAFL